MFLELRARTEAGANLIALAEHLADDFATRAAAHDRDATFPHASIAALKDAGYFAAPIPCEFGGLGVDPVEDLVVASSRLARGDASVAIGVNMHLAAVRNMVRRWRMAVAADRRGAAEAMATSLQAVARDGVVLAAAVSEPRQDLTRPATTAVRVEAGWRVDGRKIFCTMSPAATALYTSVCFRDDAGAERYGYAMVPADAPGVTVHDDWDAVGMRASGSHSVSFDGVELPASALRGGFPIGEPVPYMERNLTAGAFHASASLGIAEAAHQQALRSVGGRPGAAVEGPTRGLVAASAIDLAASRAALARSTALIDQHEADHPASRGPDDAIVAIFTEVQAVKAFVTDAAARVVDRSLTVTGGGAFRSGHPIARAYRDVRAGGFMNPLASARAHELVGRVALGLDASFA